MEMIAKLEGRQDYTIHGERYARLYFIFPEDPDNVHQCQLPGDAFDADLKPGDTVRVTMLLKTVMEMRHAPAE